RGAPLSRYDSAGMPGYARERARHPPRLAAEGDRPKAGREGGPPLCGAAPGRKMRDPLARLRMRRSEVWELVESVGVRLETVGRDVALRQEGEAVIDDVVGENPAVGILRGLRRIERQHVGQKAVGVDRRNRFLAGVAAGMPHQVDELVRPATAIVDRLAGVVFQLGVVGVEKAADRW